MLLHQLVETVSGWLYVPTGNLFKREQVQCGTSASPSTLLARADKVIE